MQVTSSVFAYKNRASSPYILIKKSIVVLIKTLELTIVVEEEVSVTSSVFAQRSNDDKSTSLRVA
ncbi:hypothetical protein KBJ98_06700 [Flavobacterium sp. F-328]|uniref:Uncharacterized protein n=1 Tax=Flavobacterium erciyesense TaxID=2825842 RepID=A0ABS5D319_9FLAO|nr:hypothetical protein [Flavobacterium erciyesense]MBQ0908386.1 hypothetical protein [Flavobacterium erciyesense]